MARKFDIIRRVTIHEIKYTVINKVTHELRDDSLMYYEPIVTHKQIKDFIESNLFYDESLVSINSLTRITGHYGISRKDYLKHSTPVDDPICTIIPLPSATVSNKSEQE